MLTVSTLIFSPDSLQGVLPARYFDPFPEVKGKKVEIWQPGLLQLLNVLNKKEVNKQG
jgi:hypothetical protein